MNVATPYTLDHLLTVANTRHGPDAHRRPSRSRNDGEHDHLATASDAVRFLADHDFQVPEERPARRNLDQLRVIRRAVEALSAGGSHGRDPETEALLASATYQLTPDGTLVAAGDGWDAVAANLFPPLVELSRLAGSLKRCDNGRCRWLFVDRSRNGSRRWCEMAVCGNRAKTVRWRATHLHGSRGGKS